MKIKKNDIVKVLAGKDRGKQGKVLKIFPSKNKAIVEGINYVSKHARKTQDNPKGGIVHREGLIDISKLSIVCARCGKPSRAGFNVLPDKSKVRICRACREII
ncbi:MAG: 50S ribosomal protein L24 [Candidatus Omnitrophica bacterium]|nr:50S ribosomal protein L24 [Candidatus Omnitrophota bacterium]